MWQWWGWVSVNEYAVLAVVKGAQSQKVLVWVWGGKDLVFK